MLLETNAFQSKPTSHEEGPMTSQSDVEIGSLRRVEKTTNYQRCMGLIKLILYLELIVFVGWIGCIFISNYYLYHPYNDDSTPHDQLDWKDDSIENRKPVSSDDIVTRLNRNDESTPRNWMHGGDDFPEDDSSVGQHMTPDDIVTRFKEDIGAIRRTDQDRTSTTPVTSVEASSSEKTTEASEEIPLSGWSGILNIPAFEDDITEDNVEEHDNSDKPVSDTFGQIRDDRIIFPDDSEYAASKIPKTGLRHVIDYHFSDLNSAPGPNVSRPFPRLPSVESDTIDSTGIPEVDDDSSTDTWFPIKSSVSTDEPSDDLGIPVVENEDYADSHMKEILFPVRNWNDYSGQSDEDDVLESSTEASPKADVPHQMSSEMIDSILRMFEHRRS